MLIHIFLFNSANKTICICIHTNAKYFIYKIPIQCVLLQEILLWTNSIDIYNNCQGQM